MTKDESVSFIIPFGKYKGELLGVVFVEDESYLQWCFENLNEQNWPEFFSACIELGIE